jgi:hypothetical protein
VSIWDHCVTHCEDAPSFIQQYFAYPDRRVLIIGGAGFDPRSTVVTASIAAVAPNRRGIYLREERPNPAAELLQRAEANVASFRQLVPQCQIESIEVFDKEDGAVVGAKRLIRRIAQLMTTSEAPSDIVLDLSALSIGIGFPLVRYVYETFGRKTKGPNVHLFVTEDPNLDSGISPEHTDQPMYVPGFDGDVALDQQSQATRLWIPQLVRNRREALRRIRDFVRAEETCPILPFPAKNLRSGDELLEHYITEITDTWEVDPRNYIYAAEQEPLDLYRTLLRLDDARKRVYQAHGGSFLVLSPIGSRALALGALLAALDRNFPVAYLESISYALPATPPPAAPHAWPIVHIWLTGDAYA